MEQNSIQTWENHQTLASRINRMISVQKNVMKKDVDFGIIPGCGDKPTLLKPGAELLCTTFKIGDRMAIGYPQREIDDYTGNITFIVILEFYDQATGNIIGQGLGVASTAEEKYAWRKAVCDEEWEAAPEEQRREKWCKGKGGEVYVIKQIRTNPKDVENTVAKMGKKRAKIDGALNVLAASRIFSQDLEDLPVGLEMNSQNQSSKPQVTQTKPIQNQINDLNNSSTMKGKKISEAQTKRLYAICKKTNLDPEVIKIWLKKNYNTDSLSDITMGDAYNWICEKIENDHSAFAIKTKTEENLPKVIDSEEFLNMATALMNELTPNEDEQKAFLGIEYGVTSLSEIPADLQSEVIDFLTNSIESKVKK